MRRTNAISMVVVSLVIVVIAAACQADAGDDAGGTPIEEPTTMSESPADSDPPDPPDPTDSTSGTGADSPTEPPPPPTTRQPRPGSTPPTTSDIFATTTTVRSAGSAGPATSTVYDVGMVDSGLAPFVTMATDDLAERLGVDATSIEVLTAVLVTWPDGGLGCPEPGRVYTQALTDGSVIELGVEGFVYRYHTGGSQGPFPCDRPLQPVPTPAG